VQSAERGDQLFDLSDDPAQQKDLAAARPHVAEQLRGELTTWAKQIPELAPSEVHLDPGTLDQLRALGYLPPGK
jgi:hypothetical protein